MSRQRALRQSARAAAAQLHAPGLRAFVFAALLTAFVFVQLPKSLCVNAVSTALLYIQEPPEGDCPPEDAAALAVVVTQYGSRQKVLRLPMVPPQVRAVFYTADPSSLEFVPPGWSVVTRPYHEEAAALFPWLDARGRHSWQNISDVDVKAAMAANFYMMNMHLLPEVKGVEMVLWKDAAGLQRANRFEYDMAESTRRLLHKHDWIARRHPARSTVAALAEGKEAQEAVESMARRGFPDRSGLFALKEFVFNASSARAQRLLLAWWHEVQRFSHREELSFPFVAWQHNLSLRVINERSFEKLMLAPQ